MSDGGMARRPEDLPAATLGEAMDYIELHRLQSLVSEALEAVVASRSPDPVAFIVRWLRRKRQASVAVGAHRYLADPHASSVAELCTTGSDRRRARPLNGTAAAYAEEGASATQTTVLTSSVRTSESAAAMAGSMRSDDTTAAMAGSMRGDDTTLEELHAARAAPKARDGVLRTPLLPEPVLRSIYAVASESSLNAALVHAPPSLQDAIACREGLWGGLVHMTLCSFSEHGGVDMRAAAEALLATTTASSELVTTCCSLLTAHCLLLTVYCSLLTAHHSPLAPCHGGAARERGGGDGVCAEPEHTGRVLVVGRATASRCAVRRPAHPRLQPHWRLGLHERGGESVRAARPEERARHGGPARHAAARRDGHACVRRGHPRLPGAPRVGAGGGPPRGAQGGDHAAPGGVPPRARA